jgi:hypothetical protein
VGSYGGGEVEGYYSTSLWWVGVAVYVCVGGGLLIAVAGCVFPSCVKGL